MRKTIVSISLALLVVMGIWIVFNHMVNSKVEARQAKDALATSEVNVSVSKEAKKQGEASTTRADERKSELRTKASATKERLRENFTSHDDEPLPDNVVVELCNTFHYSDCVRTTAGKPVAGNKG